MAKPFNHIPTQILKDQKVAEKDKPIKIYNSYGGQFKTPTSEPNIPTDKDVLIDKENDKLSLWDKIKKIFSLHNVVDGAVYRLTLMVYAPENKNGVSTIIVGLPSKKEYNKVKRAMKSKEFAKFTHLHGDLGRINLGYPIVYVAAECIKPQKGSGIIIPTEFNKVSGINYKVDA